MRTNTSQKSQVRKKNDKIKAEKKGNCRWYIAVNQFTESKAEHNRSFNKEILGHLKSLASIIEKTEDNIPMK